MRSMNHINMRVLAIISVMAFASMLAYVPAASAVVGGRRLLDDMDLSLGKIKFSKLATADPVTDLVEVDEAPAPAPEPVAGLSREASTSQEDYAPAPAPMEEAEERPLMDSAEPGLMESFGYLHGDEP